MNIVVIGPYFPYRGGISDTNQELCENLQKLGHSVIVFTFSLQYPSIFFPGKTQLSSKSKSPIIKAKRIINSLSPFNWISTVKKINNIDPDMLISCYWTPYMAPCFSFINRLINKKIKKIGLIHNAFPHENNLLQKNLLKFYLNSIDKHITFSKNVTNQINKIYNVKNGITLFLPVPKKFGEPINKNLSKEKLNLCKDSIYILFFGLIREYKGLDILIKSMSKIIEEKNKVKLLIVGENYKSIKNYKKIIKRKKLNNNILFKDKFIDENEIKYWFCCSDLVIQPYKKASQSGISSLSFQFEIPTVTTNIKGLSEYIIDNQDGFISEPNHKDLSNKILFAIDYDKKLMINKIKIKKDKYNWEKFVSHLINN
tara:strand:- start:1092 stop:2201 length:1110 start_codon:yes stop_codon:yes gene_type:complete